MFLLVVFMLLAVAVGAVVLVYVAYPHRGEEVPGAPWLGDAMKRGVESLPTLDNQAAQQEARSPRRPDLPPRVTETTGSEILPHDG